jgi:cyanophycin synthetase
MAEVEFVSSDLELSHFETGGVIAAVRYDADLPRHQRAAIAAGKDIAGAIVERMLPDDGSGRSPGRIPIAAITGTNGKSTTCHMLAKILEAGGLTVGMATSLGVSINGRLAVEGDVAGVPGARAVLQDPTVEAAVLETARGGILRRGLAFPDCDVAAMLNVTPDHLGEHGVDSLEKMAMVKRVVVHAARACAVVNADDPLCLATADGAPARHVCLVTLDPGNAKVAGHLAAGGRAALIEAAGDGKGEVLVLRQGEERLFAMAADEIPATHQGRAVHNMQNALFAAALAWGLERPWDEIRGGLAAFMPSFETLPGRANIHLGHPFPVIYEHAHNPDGFAVVGRMVTRFAEGGRRICVFSSPPDRPDSLLVEIARTAAQHFDHFICRDNYVQLREPGEIPQMLRAALLEAGVTEDRIQVINDPKEAVQAGLAMAGKGDVLFVMTSMKPDETTWRQITEFQPG